jgi:hypothetical protein
LFRESHVCRCAGAKRTWRSSDLTIANYWYAFQAESEVTERMKSGKTAVTRVKERPGFQTLTKKRQKEKGRRLKCGRRIAEGSM